MKKNKISKNWVNKQRRDIYVRQSKVDGYRARSAYKLIEIDEKFKIFKGLDLESCGTGFGNILDMVSNRPPLGVRQVLGPT